jgi:hypothetical protein
MDIRPDLPFRFAKDLPDMAQNDVSIAAGVGRFGLVLHLKSDQRQICCPQDGRAQTRRSIVQQQDHICPVVSNPKAARTARLRSSVSNKRPSPYVMVNASNSMASN